MRKLLLTGSALLLATVSACATNTMSEGMSTEQFGNASPEKQKAELDRLREKPVLFEEFWTLKLLAHEPVTWTYNKVDYTLLCGWNPLKGYRTLTAWYGQEAVNLDRDASSAFSTVQANGNCEPDLRATGQMGPDGEPFYAPVTLQNDSSMSQGFWSAFALRNSQAILQNTGAIALKDALGPDCAEGSQCGGIANYVRADASSASIQEDYFDFDSNVEVNLGAMSGGVRCDTCTGMPTD